MEIRYIPTIKLVEERMKAASIAGSLVGSDKVYYSQSNLMSKFGRPLDVIGRGTFGIVYNTNKGFAMKMSTDNDSEVGITSENLREITVLKYLQHPNIVPIYGVFLYGPDVRFTMPLAETTLDNIIKNESYDRMEMKRAIYQILRGLAYCHSQLIWHLDIKPANILRLGYGKYLIADFGSVEIYAINGKKHNVDDVTTLWWRAPELLVYNTYYTEKVDVWSVGVILLQMLLGYDYFGEEEDEEDMLNLISKLLGTPNDTVLPGSSEYIARYKIPAYSGELNTLITNQEDLSFIRKLLAWPNDRITALDAINDSYFDEVRSEIEHKYPAKPIIKYNCGEIMLQRQIQLNDINVDQAIRVRNFNLLWEVKMKIMWDYHSLFLTYLVIDSYFSLVKLNLDEIYLILMASFSLADKLNDGYLTIEDIKEDFAEGFIRGKFISMDGDEIERLMKTKYDANRILKKEDDILRILDLNLILPTCVNFSDYLISDQTIHTNKNIIFDIMVVIMSNNIWAFELSQYEIAQSAIDIVSSLVESPDSICVQRLRHGKSLSISQLLSYIETTPNIGLFERVKQVLK